jgi:hypothetical protein
MGALLVEPYEVERILADVDANCRNGFNDSSLAWHGMLLVFAAPCQPCGWVGREHGGSIPLAGVSSEILLRCTARFSRQSVLMWGLPP